MKTQEEWRAVEEFPLFSVSSLGRVRKGTRILRSWKRFNTHKITLRDRETAGGFKVNRYVAKLVAAAFLPPRPTRHHVVAFRDGNRANLAASNLFWALPEELELARQQQMLDRIEARQAQIQGD